MVEIVATQFGIASGCQYLENTFMQPENGDVEGSATQIVGGKNAFRSIVQPISDSGGCRFAQQSRTWMPASLAASLVA